MYMRCALCSFALVLAEGPPEGAVATGLTGSDREDNDSKTWMTNVRMTRPRLTTSGPCLPNQRPAMII